MEDESEERGEVGEVERKSREPSSSTATAWTPRDSAEHVGNSATTGTFWRVPPGCPWCAPPVPLPPPPPPGPLFPAAPTPPGPLAGPPCPLPPPGPE